MKEKLKEIIDLYHPKVLTQKIRSLHPEIYQWVQAQMFPVKPKTFKEKIYLVLTKADPVCSRSEKPRRFLGMDRGHGYCGSLKTCACHKDALGEINRKPNSEESKIKQKETWLRTLGVDNPMKLSSIAKKVHTDRKQVSNSKVLIKQGFVQVTERVSASPMFGPEDYAGCSSKNKYLWKCRICENNFEDHVDNGHEPRCPVCYPSQTSLGEQEIADYLTSLGIKIERQVYGRSSGELDIYLPEFNLAIEYNGLYWHSDKFRNKSYHLEKTISCRASGIRLIHIFEDEWKAKHQLVKNRLRSILGMAERTFARKCKLKEINLKEYRAFCTEHHLRGSAPASLAHGLFENDKLVAVMSWGRSRYTNHEWELVRYCSQGTVVGGASRLFRHFLRTKEPESIVSYADRAWNTGRLYQILGFNDVTNQTQSNVGFWYVKRDLRYHRSTFQKKKLVEMGYDQKLTGDQIMRQLGFLVVYDCGNFKFEWSKKGAPKSP